jgi:hypothetical protein
MVKVAIREELFEPISQMAEKAQTSAENLIDEWLSQQLALKQGESRSDSADANLEKDRQVFAHLKANLLKSHPGEYAVIKDGELIAVGPDQQTLVDEAYRRFGVVDLYVKRIEPTERVYRISGPRVARPG